MIRFDQNIEIHMITVLSENFSGISWVNGILTIIVKLMTFDRTKSIN
jgi:hypothetical protein